MSAKLSALGICVAFALAGTAYAQGTEKQKSKDEYKAALEKCKGMKGNEKHVCTAEAESKKDIAEAQSKLAQSNTPKNQYEFEKTKADAEYKVAKAKCGNEVGNAQAACEEQAKAERDKARAQAKQQSEAKSGTGESSSGGQSSAGASSSAQQQPPQKNQ